MPIPQLELLTRIGIGACLGAVIGYERDRHGRPVGLRTHLLVGMAAATFMVISSQFIYWQHYSTKGVVEVDTSRIAASVVSGIGFLAGGAILRTGVTVQGLTTAAGLWVVTAVGMCAGAGMYPEAVMVTAMALVALTILRRFEDKNDNMERRKISIRFQEAGDNEMARIDEILQDLGAEASQVEVDRKLDDRERPLSVILDIEVADALSLNELVKRLEHLGGVAQIKVWRQH